MAWADTYAASAADTFAHIPYQRRVVHIPRNRLPDLVKDIAADVVLRRQRLQLALAVSLAVQAVLRMVCQNQLQTGLAGLADLWRIGGDVACLVHQIVAGGFQSSAPAVLYQTDTAEGKNAQVGMVAQGWNLHADCSGGLHDGGAVFHRQGLAVDRNIYHFSTRPPLKMP